MRISDWSSDVCFSDLVQSPCYAADGGCSAIGPADDAARPPVDVHPDHDSIAQELERVNGARRIEHEAEIMRILHRRHDPPFDVAQRQDVAVASRLEGFLLIAAPLLRRVRGLRRAGDGKRRKGAKDRQSTRLN